MLTWAFLPSAGFLAFLCYLVDSRRIITTARSGRICYFMAFYIYFPMYPNLITPVCVCVTAHIAAEISAVIPSAKDSYLALVS